MKIIRELREEIDRLRAMIGGNIVRSFLGKYFSYDQGHFMVTEQPS